MKKLVQHNPPHPGSILLTLYLEPLQLSVSAAAELLRITRPNLSTIINERAGISPTMALKLSKVFSTTPQFWLNLQSNYDLWYASLDLADEIKKLKPLQSVKLKRKLTKTKIA